MNQGWICPKCNAVMSPFQPTCWYCGPKQKDECVGGKCESNSDSGGWKINFCEKHRPKPTLEKNK